MNSALQDLSLALRQKSKGEADLLGLDEDYANAVKTRDTRLAVPDSQGFTSIFSAISDGIRRSRGEKEIDAIKPQREAARLRVADRENALPLYNAKLAAEKVNTNTSRYNEQQKQLKKSVELEAQRHAIARGDAAAALGLTAEKYAALQLEKAAALGLSAEKYAILQAEKAAKLGLSATQYAVQQGRIDAKLKVEAEQYTTSQNAIAAALGLTAEKYSVQQQQEAAALGLTAEKYAVQQQQEAAALGLTAEKYAVQQQQKAAALKLTEDNLETTNNQRTGATTEYYDSITNAPVRISLNGKGEYINSRGEVMSSLEGLTKAPDKNLEGIGMGSYGDKYTDKLATDATQLMGSAVRVAKKLKGLSPEAARQLNSGKIRFGEFLLTTMTPKKAVALVKEQYSGYGREAQDFLVGLSRMSAGERHELFGAALTEGEELSGEEFLTFVRGLSYEQIMGRVSDTYQYNRNKIETLDKQKGENRYMDILTRTDWEKTFATNPDIGGGVNNGMKSIDDMTNEELEAELSG